MANLVGWWLVLEVAGLISLPLAFVLFSERADRGYAFAKILTLLSVTWVAWLAAHGGFLAVDAALGLALLVFIAGNAFLAWRHAADLGSWIASRWRSLLVVDALWTAGFLFFAWQRSLAPEIFGAEKYMDFAFLNALTRVDSMPPEDPWMAGEAFNYYYLGYLMMAYLWRLLPIDAAYAYNLSVAMLAGLAFSQAASIGRALAGRWRWGIVAGLLTMLVTNLDGFLQWWEKGTLYGLDYWRSTRVVGDGDTINEFPFFTAVHGDLHPHFIVLPVTLLLLALLVDPGRKRLFASGGFTWPDAGLLATLAFVYGAAFTISLWELPVGGMMIFLLLQRDLPLGAVVSGPRLRVAAAAIAVLVVAYLAYLPFHLHYDTPDYGGVGVKLAATNFFEFLTVFATLLLPGTLIASARLRAQTAIGNDLATALALGGVLLVLVAFLMGNAVLPLLALLAAVTFAAAYRTDDVEARTALLLFLGAVIALLMCEIVYLKDPYGDRLYRMNTVFKLYLQAWILLALASAWFVRELWQARGALRAPALGGLVLFPALAAAGLVYPLSMSVTRLAFRPIPRTLDGMEYLQREHPDDFGAIAWLRSEVEGMPVLLEASGNPYSYYARFSSNTGLPTVMGWANHEGLWRSHDAAVGARQAEVRRIYEAASLAEVEELLDRHAVRFIVVGELERRDHPGAGLAKFESLPVAVRSGATVVYDRG